MESTSFSPSLCEAMDRRTTAIVLFRAVARSGLDRCETNGAREQGLGGDPCSGAAGCVLSECDKRTVGIRNRWNLLLLGLPSNAVIEARRLWVRVATRMGILGRSALFLG